MGRRKGGLGANAFFAPQPAPDNHVEEAAFEELAIPPAAEAPTAPPPVEAPPAPGRTTYKRTTVWLRSDQHRALKRAVRRLKDATDDEELTEAEVLRLGLDWVLEALEHDPDATHTSIQTQRRMYGPAS